MPTGGLVVLVGSPGSGKTTMANERWPGCVVSVDAFRDGFDREATREAFAKAYAETVRRLSSGQLVVFDSTGVTGRVRAALQRIAENCGVPAHVVVVDTDNQEAAERNRAREVARVPERTLLEMRVAFNRARSAVRFERWESVSYV